jgi:hypothetical protein
MSSTTAPPTDAYLPWDAKDVETIKPNEEDTSRQIGQVMTKMQNHNFDRHRRAFTATHVKTQGIVKGTLTVLPDLPSHLQQGIFRTPGKTYDVAARYSNEPIFLQADQEQGPRGLGMRVFGVEGERLETADANATTQDFLFNNAPSIELTDVETCLEIMRLREKHFHNPEELIEATKKREDAEKQMGPCMSPLPHPNLTVALN